MASSVKVTPVKDIAHLEEAHYVEEVDVRNDKIKLESIFEGLGSFGRLVFNIF